MRRAIVWLAIEPLVLEEQDGVVAADCGPQQPARIERIRGHNHSQTRYMCERDLAALAVVHRTAVKVAANWHANDDRTREAVIGSPANVRQFVTDLHHRRPNVIEELDLCAGL